MDKIDNGNTGGVEAVFERWELNISGREALDVVPREDQSPASSLQREFDDEERQAQLRDELSALIIDEQSKSDD